MSWHCNRSASGEACFWYWVGGGASFAGVGQPVGGGAGFDDLPGEGQPVDDGRAQPWVGEGLGPRGERLVGGDRHRRAFFTFGEDLEQQLRAAPVQLQVAQLVDQDQINAAVAGDQLGQLLDRRRLRRVR